MKKEVVFTEKAPKPVGPYSQAIRVGSHLFCSGQVPLTAEGHLIEGCIQKETEQVMKNLACVLKAAKLNFSHVVKCSIFLTDMEDFQAVNEVYARFFIEAPPARECIQVAKLPLNARVEISLIAAS